MAKPTKGNKTKRPNSDERRIDKAHVALLKRDRAIVSSSFDVPKGFKSMRVSNSLIRIKGPGAWAIKHAPKDKLQQVITLVAERSWKALMKLVSFDRTIIDYKVESTSYNKD